MNTAKTTDTLREPGKAESPVLVGPLLVGLDSDERCDGAAKRAAQLSTRFGLPVDFMHVLPSGPKGSASRNDVRASLERHLSKLLATQGNVTLGSGKAADEILSHATDTNAGLIILGPHVKHGLLDLGNTARAVLEDAPCPVWVEPNTDPGPIYRVLVPVDLSEDSRAAAVWARGLARRLDARLTLLHVHESPALAPPPLPGSAAMDPSYAVAELQGTAREEFGRFSHETVPEATTRFESGMPVEAILEQQGGHDLIVMSTVGRGTVASAVLGSVAHGVLRKARRPVVALRRPARRGND